jgi:hypothetical protein
MDSRYADVDLVTEGVHLCVVQGLVQQAVYCLRFCDDRSDGPEVVIHLGNLGEISRPC